MEIKELYAFKRNKMRQDDRQEFTVTLSSLLLVLHKVFRSDLYSLDIVILEVFMHRAWNQ